MYVDDQFSTTSSQWTTTYGRLPKKQPFAIKFLSWAAGAPRGATVMKKRTRDYPDDRSQRSGGSSRSYFVDQDMQMYWIAVPDARSYSSGSSTTSRRSKKSSRKHFDGQPMPRQPPPPPGMGFGGPVDGHFSPPPPPMQGPPMPMPMDDGMGMMDGDMHMGGGYHGMAPPPPPPPPMNGPPAPGGAPAFFDVTGQNQPGNPFQGGGGGGYNSGSEYYTDSEYDEASVYSGHY